jgi:hypothetical protein
MRIALPLVVLLFAVPHHAAADPVVFLEFLNSDFTFGQSADQEGWDLSAFWAEGFDDSSWDVWNTGYQAVAGELDHQTPAAGGTAYVYLGGTFEIFFSMENGGDRRTGSFVAPIESLTVLSGVRGANSVDLFYELGAGLFDASIADTLGISRRTTGGEARAQLLLMDTDDAPGVRVTPVQQASDGVNDITLEVAEPATLALLAVGAAGLFRRRKTMH